MIEALNSISRLSHRHKLGLLATIGITAVFLPSLLLDPSSFSSFSFRRLHAPAPVFNSYNPIPETDELESLFQQYHHQQQQDSSSPIPSVVVGGKVIQPYSLENVLRAIDIFQNTFAVIVYDPSEDAFTAYYNRNHYWNPSCAKLIGSFRFLSKTLFKMFPERFVGGDGSDSNSNSPEWAFAMTSGDFPSIKSKECYMRHDYDGSCIDDESYGVVAPILQFGSVFQNPVIPSMIAMPNPQPNHLHCFWSWVEKEGREVCEYYRERNESNPNGLVFGETVGVTSWEELIPTVVWRGTDFPGYLHNVREFRQPDFQLDVKRHMDAAAAVHKKGSDDDESFKVESAIDAMKEVYDYLIPRWKGVVLTASAEFEADQQRKMEGEDSNIVPWADIKFADCIHDKAKTLATEVGYYKQFMSVGIPAGGQKMSLEELAKYKYHIDIGGGGGTTWSGTIEKLAMPGLLFHHITPAKDYNYEILVPWVHYVPIKEDLSDLKEKFDWAEANPLLAQQISAHATELARALGTQEGFGKVFHDLYEEPLRKVIQAYQPSMESWKIVMKRLTGTDMKPIMKCSRMFCENLSDNPTSWKQLSGVQA